MAASDEVGHLSLSGETAEWGAAAARAIATRAIGAAAAAGPVGPNFRHLTDSLNEVLGIVWDGSIRQPLPGGWGVLKTMMRSKVLGVGLIFDPLQNTRRPP